MRADDAGDDRREETGGEDPRIVTLEQLIEPSIEDAGYELVRVEIMTGGGRTLQVMIERKDRIPISVDDCADVSRLLSAILDVEDPLPGSYNLEVSSPGLDRPLVRLADYERFAGFEARIEMDRPLEGRRRFRGRLTGVERGDRDLVCIVCDGEGTALPFSGIRRASLVVTDDLIEAASREAAAALEKH
jgi:ribosome maturation factor RimP